MGSVERSFPGHIVPLGTPRAPGRRSYVSRTTITSAQLYAILDREFRALRKPECEKCRIPLPYWRRPPDDVSANWNIGTPTECPHGCHLVIAELLTKLWSRYDVEPERPQ